MSFQLNKDALKRLPDNIAIGNLPKASANVIIHFGVGGFHRAHQAYAVQKLIDQGQNWVIHGVGIRPGDKNLAELMQDQDHLYTLQSSGYKGVSEVKLIGAIARMFYGPDDTREIIAQIASDKTRLVSLTITEGGYLMDEATGEFKIDDSAIVWDLDKSNEPQTVFGYLARGLAERAKTQAEGLTLLSCDNLQENGKILKKGFLEFLKKYDPQIHEYAVNKLVFPCSMVDRITPATTKEDLRQFETRYGYRDQALVVSEDYFQWVIEGPLPPNFPPLDRVGAQYVDQVVPYEQMKLRILNGGHSLVGLMGANLGYEYIHDSVNDPLIAQMYQRYVEETVVPGLDSFEPEQYLDYFERTKKRFQNPSIQDQNSRIISFSAAKLPKFVLPVIRDAGNQDGRSVLGIFLLANWWFYLKGMVGSNRTEEIQDSNVNLLIAHFKNSDGMGFFSDQQIFGDLARDNDFVERSRELSELLNKHGVREAAELILTKKII